MPHSPGQDHVLFDGSISEIFASVRDYAHGMVDHPSAEKSWKLACEILHATRRIQDLIGQLRLLRVELCPQELDSNASVGFTCPTAFSQAPVLSSVQRTSEAESQQVWELHQNSRNMQGKRHGSEVASTVRSLGLASYQAGDLEEAQKHFEESLQMTRSLHGDGDHPDIVETLCVLAFVTFQAGHLQEGQKHLEEFFRMSGCLNGNDHPDTTLTLQELGLLTQEVLHLVIPDAGDLKQAQKHLEESLRMTRCLYGDTDHPDIAATMAVLSLVAQEAGDLEQAHRHLEESLQMTRSLQGNRDHRDIAVKLRELGLLTERVGDVEQAQRHLEESLRMCRSLNGEKDHPDTVEALRHLALVMCREHGTLFGWRDDGDLQQAQKHLVESLRMTRSLHGSGDDPDIAMTLRYLAWLAEEVGDPQEAQKCLNQ